MNLQELKEKLIERLSEKCDRLFVTGMVEACFYVFEQSNKENQASETENQGNYLRSIWEDGKPNTCYVMRFEIEKGMDLIIKQINDNFKEKDREIESLQKEIEALKSKKDESEPKQERFTLKDYAKDAVDMQILKDGELFDYAYRKNADLVCKALNSLAKGE